MAKRKNNAREKAKCDQKILNGLKLILSDDKYISRNELCSIFEEADEKIRKAKKVLSYDIAILSDKQGKGYRKAKHSNNLNTENEFEIEIHNINKQLAYLGSYYNSLKMTMRPLIAHKKMLEKAKKERFGG